MALRQHCPHPVEAAVGLRGADVEIYSFELDLEFGKGQGSVFRLALDHFSIFHGVRIGGRPILSCS